MGPNRGRLSAKSLPDAGPKQTELPLGAGAGTKRALDAVDGIRAGLEELRQTIVEAFVMPEPPPPPPEPAPVFLVSRGGSSARREGRAVHAFHVRFDEDDLESLRRVAQLSDCSQQRIARLAIREYCERVLAKERR